MWYTIHIKLKVCKIARKEDNMSLYIFFNTAAVGIVSLIAGMKTNCMSLREKCYEVTIKNDG